MLRTYAQKMKGAEVGKLEKEVEELENKLRYVKDGY